MIASSVPAALREAGAWSPRGVCGVFQDMSAARWPAMTAPPPWCTPPLPVAFSQAQAPAAGNDGSGMRRLASPDFAQATCCHVEDEAADLVGVIEERVRLHPGNSLPEVFIHVGEGQ